MRPLPLAALALAALALAAPFAPAVPAPASGPSVDCNPACNVRVSGGTGPANEVTIAVSPTDADNLLAGGKDYSLGSPACATHNVWAGVYTSHDGGKTWKDQMMPGYPGGTPGALSVYQCSSDPVVAFTSLGHALYSGLGIGAVTNGVWVGASVDGGDSWPVIDHVALGTGLRYFHDKNWIGADPSLPLAYVAWDASGALMLSRSVDGAAWTPPVFAPGALPLPPQNYGLGAQPFVGPDHAVYVGWDDGGIYVARSTTFGATWEQPVLVANPVGFPMPNTPYRVFTLPNFAVDTSSSPHSGTLYATWHDGRFSGSPDIVVARSSDGGKTWSAPVRVSDDPPGPDVQLFPTVAVGPDGSVHVSWYDRRDDPSNYKLDLYYSVSHDGGKTWSPNLRVTTQSSDPKYSFHQNGFEFMGDYMQIAVGKDGVAHPVWTDTRDGRSDAYTGRIVP